MYYISQICFPPMSINIAKMCYCCWNSWINYNEKWSSIFCIKIETIMVSCIIFIVCRRWLCEARRPIIKYHSMFYNKSKVCEIVSLRTNDMQEEPKPKPSPGSDQLDETLVSPLTENNFIYIDKSFHIMKKIL